MKIRLVGALPEKIRDLGIKSGSEWNAEPAPNGKYGSMLIRLIKDDQEVIATVYQENYKKI